uniref:glutaredoxin-dependent peroxiredoxin n=1 Tax=Tetraselmis sp. GSL018 TaxID=582737 RepID=A0A061S719_9CHLO
MRTSLVRRAAGALARGSPWLQAGATASTGAWHEPGKCTCPACASRGSRTVASSAAALADAKQDTYNVPLGHLNSDLSSTSCHIGLGRRRDLSLRGDVSLTSLAGEKQALTHWLKGKNVVVFGIPDGGSVCVGEHIPGYEKLAGELKKCDIDAVLCVMVGDVSEVKAVADKATSPGVLTFVADTNGGFTRLLGLDLAEPSAPGPRSQRYAGIIENGILVKLRVESDIGKVSESGCERILELLQCKRDEKMRRAGM